MRIAVSNPDNLGDFILRQPMLAALVEAGHEVLLIVRAHVAPLAAWSVPGATVLQCAGDPYAPRFQIYSPPDDRLVAAVQAFDPDIFVAAAYQHSQLEEQLASQLPRAQCIGFGGELRQNDSSLGITHVSAMRLAIRVTVGRDWHESRKNELLCGAVLGRSVTLSRPQLEADARFVEIASARMRREGMQDRKFWVVCAGEGSEYTKLKNWTLAKWAELCTALVREEKLHLVFIGTEAEHESTAAVRALMGDAAGHTLDMTAQSDGLDMLVGLLSLSSGYVGKDTGPMHIAASLGKPVVAVFGGGHWPRFVPKPLRGAVIGMRVPCVGCDWICPYKTSHCVKDVPMAPVLNAVRAELREEPGGFETILLEQEEWAARAMVLEAAETARAATHALTVERSNFHQWHADRVTDIERLREQIAQLEAQKQEFAKEREGWSATLDQFRAASAQQNAESQELRQTVELGGSVARRLARIQERSARKLLEGMAQRAALQATVGELSAGNADLQERVEGLLAEIGVAKEEIARLEQECAERALEIDAANVRLNDISSRDEGFIGELRQQLQRKEAELRSVLALVPDLRDELSQYRIEADRSAARQATIDRLEALLLEVEADRTERLRVIEGNASRLEELESDQREKQALIERLSEMLTEAEADRAQRLRVIEAHADQLEELTRDQQSKQALIERLSATLTEVEADRAERLHVMEATAGRLEDLMRDQQAKQALIERLSATLGEVEADRAERGKQIGILTQIAQEQREELGRLQGGIWRRLTTRARRP